MTTNNTTATEATATEAEAVQTTEHLRACFTELSARFDKLTTKLDKLEGDALKARYVKDGAIVWAKKFMDAGGKLGDLLVRADDIVRYDELSNLTRVARRFGTEIPARFTTWSAIVLAVTLTDEQIDGIESMTVKASDVRAVKKAAKDVETSTTVKASAAQDGQAARVSFDPTDLAHQQLFAEMANAMAAHVNAGGETDAAVWASLKISLNMILD